MPIFDVWGVHLPGHWTAGKFELVFHKRTSPLTQPHVRCAERDHFIDAVEIIYAKRMRKDLCAWVVQQASMRAD
eukprot:5209491-Amphidinium_carterae.1